MASISHNSVIPALTFDVTCIYFLQELTPFLYFLSAQIVKRLCILQKESHIFISNLPEFRIFSFLKSLRSKRLKTSVNYFYKILACVENLYLFTLALFYLLQAFIYLMNRIHILLPTKYVSRKLNSTSKIFFTTFLRNKASLLEPSWSGWRA